MNKKIIFIDRDGTILKEPPTDYQIDRLDKFSFLPEVLYYLKKIQNELDFLFVMVTNQDGLGTDSFPEDTFWPYQNLMMNTLTSEGITFHDVRIDHHRPEDNSPMRKPDTGMLTSYLVGNYDLKNSFVIGDRWSDMQLARNLGCQGLLLQAILADEEMASPHVTQLADWKFIYRHLKSLHRKSNISRSTFETDITVQIDLDGSGLGKVDTGLPFFDHMLDQCIKHGQMDMWIKAKGDLHIDEHHTIEDVAITIGQSLKAALGGKTGISRYGFALPMDDCAAVTLIDFGGRAWLEWDVEFKREKIGELPTEMFYHFFKSLSDHAQCNLFIQAKGLNEHHKIEAIFKAFARAVKMAIKRDVESDNLPSTKGLL